MEANALMLHALDTDTELDRACGTILSQRNRPGERGQIEGVGVENGRDQPRSSLPHATSSLNFSGRLNSFLELWNARG